MKPRETRYPVHLAVRYAVAKEFVSEYAENLSAGGLFVAGTADVELSQRVTVEVSLPGARTYSVQAEVVHFLGEKKALETGRRPGIGLRVVEPTPEYEKALASYLQRLSRRAGTSVLVRNPGYRGLLGKAGYHAREAPPAEDMLAELVKIEDPVLAIVVPSSEHDEYTRAVEQSGREVTVLTMDFEKQFDDILNRLDFVDRFRRP